MYHIISCHVLTYSNHHHVIPHLLNLEVPQTRGGERDEGNACVYSTLPLGTCKFHVTLFWMWGDEPER